VAKKKEHPNFPPQGFWLSERGAVVPVQIHAEALILLPDIFGLDKAPHGKDEINAAMEAVIKKGWIRGRMLTPWNLSFQVWEADRDSVGAIYDFVLENPGGISYVTIETIQPPGWWQFTFQEFLDKSYPQGWRLGHIVGARPEED
jgi:hypothetical protein